MLTVEFKFHRVLRERLFREIEAEREWLGVGSATTLDEYKAHSGRIRGLSDAADMAYALEKELTGRTPEDI